MRVRGPFGLIGFIWWALALVGVGCGATPARGLVYVTISQEFSPVERAGIAAGIRFWDEVGAHLRTADQMSDAERAQIGHVVELGFIPSEIPLEASMGWYDVATNRVRFDRGQSAKLSLGEMTTLGAHETGHAFGIEHLSGPAVMEPDGVPRAGLLPADVAEFESRFGSWQ